MKRLTLGELLKALEGLAPDAPVIVGIINGPRFNAAYAQHMDCAGAPAAYICCYEEARPWEGTTPTVKGDGTATLALDPHVSKPAPPG